MTREYVLDLVAALQGIRRRRGGLERCLSLPFQRAFARLKARRKVSSAEVVLAILHVDFGPFAGCMPERRELS